MFYESGIIGRSKDVASADGRHTRISVIIILSLELCVMSCRSLRARVKNIPFDQFCFTPRIKMTQNCESIQMYLNRQY